MQSRKSSITTASLCVNRAMLILSVERSENVSGGEEQCYLLPTRYNVIAHVACGVESNEENIMKMTSIAYENNIQ